MPRHSAYLDMANECKANPYNIFSKKNQFITSLNLKVQRVMMQVWSDVDVMRDSLYGNGAAGMPGMASGIPHT